MNVLDLFSGIGGFSLGLERAGMRTVALCEIEPYARAVLKKHWPSVACGGDITKREFVKGEADVVCGGFPCQDISTAGNGAGLAGERSGLWRELLRAIRVVRPKYAVVENVAALLSRGMGTVLGDLAQIGYDAEWHCIPACAVGAPHRRDRVWIIADPGGEQYQSNRAPFSGTLSEKLLIANTDQMVEPAIVGAPCEGPADSPEHPSHPGGWRWWATEPDVGRVAHGVPARVDRLKGLGNAVVPQIPQIIGEVIMQREGLAP